MTPQAYRQLLSERVLIIDGAMGTMVQRLGLGPDAYGGEEFQMLGDILVFSRPEAVKGIHLEYFRAGAMAVETDTFGASPYRLEEFDFSRLDLTSFPKAAQDLNRLSIEELTLRLNREAAQLARAALETYKLDPDYDGRPLLVLGSIGPSNKVLSPTHADLKRGSFAGIIENFRLQVTGLIEGGADVILFETQQDMLELKAAVMGAQKAFLETGVILPIQAQVTVDQFSKMQIFASDIHAALTTLEYTGIDAFGINCSIGPDLMGPTVAKLAQYSRIPICVIPNAGMPESENGQTVFKLSPEQFAKPIAEYVEKYGVNVVGGCCGTSPAHIKALAALLQGKKPKARVLPTEVYISGPQKAVALNSAEALIRIGERLNVRGSKQVRDAVERPGSIDQDVLEEVVTEQTRDLGLEVLDICMDSNQVNTADTLVAVLQHQCVDFSGAFCLDSFDVDALKAAIEVYPGRPIVNSISLEEYSEGVDKVDAVLEATKAHGPVYIALTTGPKGPAVTADEKVDLASQILKKAIEKHGLLPQQFLVDVNAFPIGSESDPALNFAQESLNSIPRIKALYPGVKTTIGVGNLTNGLAQKPYMRKVLTSVFLDEGRKVGLDAAIVNPNHYVPAQSLDPNDYALGLKVIHHKDMEAFAQLEEIALAKKGGPVVQKTAYEDLEPVAQVCQKIKDGFKARVEGRVQVGEFSFTYQDNIVETLAEVVRGGIEPLVLINDHLMVAMEELGQGFAEGQVSLPHLLKAADVMKQVMGFLEAYMKSKTKGAEIPNKGTIVLGTVYQDVHSIGKDLTKTLMENYGYKVIDLGVQVPLQTFIDQAKESGAGYIGLSALLVQTSNHMITLSKMLVEQGLEKKIDLLIGGAPVNRRHAAYVGLAGSDDLAQMRANVFYCRSAMDGVNILGQLADPGRRDQVLAKNREALEQAYRAGQNLASQEASLLNELPRRVIVAAPAVDWNKLFAPKRVEIKLTEFLPKINKTLLYTLNWKYGGKGSWAQKGVTQAQLDEQLNQWASRAEAEGWIVPQGVYGLFAAQAQGDRVTLYNAQKQTLGQVAFNPVIGQGKKDQFSVAQYFGEAGHSYIGLQLSTAGPEADRAVASLKGADSESAWIIQGLADRVAEDMGAYLNQTLNLAVYGPQSGPSCRYSPGYPALKDLENNRVIFDLLGAGERVGVSLTEGDEFSPLGSTAAVVSFHQEAGFH
ncbi:MAG: hypothetical protein A2527_06380 [Candidatus Lambdaproteobacteria bacterium RIFOXYD2_FULL_50_16]|uniref:Methionine synthase n=1 Tax=Candidatus Lambdaproteobacteria bacterium RIFOXYD2_FULL_50_16 TaxID=1817772 RepID=A0A1F6GA21_9PROT|nr:MAG: hypothetical protein A2527_06380 [Candidatus Lambdaproteobacteria bacterium RIFOXYD2_FULL_50_16]